MSDSTLSADQRTGVSSKALVSFTLDGAPRERAIPVSGGIPLPRGTIREASRLQLLGSNGRVVPAQFEPLALWPDGSLRAVRFDFLTEEGTSDNKEYLLSEVDSPQAASKADSLPRIAVSVKDDRLSIGTLDAGELELDFPLSPPGGKEQRPTWEPLRILTCGPVRRVFEAQGRYRDRRGSWIRVVATVYPETPHLEISVTLRNDRRARHRGGLWDLGDPNSYLFRSFAVVARRDGPHEIFTRVEPGEEQRGPLTRAACYQDSSGGENWQSMNHVNRHGEIPCRFQGYEYADDLGKQEGRRACPTMALAGQSPLLMTLPGFWEQFPKALSAEPDQLHAGLFPEQWNDLHELQPGEQKTHTIWLSLTDDITALDFAHHPPLPIFPLSWLAQCELFETFPDDPARDSVRYQNILATTIDPARGLAARREVIDEFGWRNWGELWADHERPADYDGPPIISHYNNQYDVVEGCLRHFARSGNRAWWNLALPLARHNIDIDTYHTGEDRAVYNNGPFWHTDHYLPAHTATHRTYTHYNARDKRAYGGGPGPSHCYSTGFLHAYYLTGDPVFREAVVGLAEWLIALEDGAQTELGVLDAGPTGVSTVSCEPWYHGPGRSPANVVNTFVDAWELTNEPRYRDHAEAIIRRVTAASSDVAALELHDIERRWFYILYVLALAKYLDAKHSADEIDDHYQNAIAAGRAIVAWMLESERPFSDRIDEVEFPTETWGAQDIRMANAMRRMARYCEEPLAGQLYEKGNRIAERGWEFLLSFGDRATMLRPTAILLIEGLRDEYFRQNRETPRPMPDAACFPNPEPPFQGQRERIREQLRTPSGALRATTRIVNPRNWPRMAKTLRRRL